MNFTPDQIFEIACKSLSHCGDSLPIQIRDRVFICDLDDLPPNGVSKKRFTFQGQEILPEHISFNGSDYYVDDCNPLKQYTVERGYILNEKSVD